MTDEQIDAMLKMHRYLIKCELNALIFRMNKEKDAELSQIAFNDTKWEDFAKSLKNWRQND